jgi:hypothetical protein
MESSRAAKNLMESNTKRNLSGGFGSWPDGAIDTLPAGAPHSAEIVFELQAHPDFGRGPQITRQAQGSVCRDAAPAAHDIVQAGGRDIERFSELIHAHAERLQDIFAYGLPRMGRRNEFGHGETGSFLMVAGDFRLERILALPAEADAEPVVDADGAASA